MGIFNQKNSCLPSGEPAWNSSLKSGQIDLMFVILFLFAWAFLFWKCRFGFATHDEPFYLTIPFRF